MKRSKQPQVRPAHRPPEGDGIRPAAKRACTCFIRHPQTPEEREQVQDALKYARGIGDHVGIQLALAQLAGPCPAWEPGG